MTSPRAPVHRFLAIAATALDALRVNRARSAVTVLTLTALLTPIVANAALYIGAVRAAQDDPLARTEVVVSGQRLERDVPLPPDVTSAVAALEHVEQVQRVIARPLSLGRDRVAAHLLGLEPSQLANLERLVIQGRLPQDGDGLEIAIGRPLARRLGLRVDDLLPPFYSNRRGERVARIVGLLDGATVERQRTVLATFSGASFMADADEWPTALHVRAPSHRARALARAIRELDIPSSAGPPLRLRARRRDTSLVLLSVKWGAMESWFLVQLVPALALGIPLLLLLAGTGSSDRERSTGLLRALGWTINDLLLQGIVRTVILGVIGALCALAAASIWLTVFGGIGIASVYAPDADQLSGLRLPYDLFPEPAILALGIALIFSVTGSVLATWRAGTASPAKAMQ